MTGISFLIDETGKKYAVIDLEKYGKLFEDTFLKPKSTKKSIKPKLVQAFHEIQQIRMGNLNGKSLKQVLDEC
jgi:hypothetical protein